MFLLAIGDDDTTTVDATLFSNGLGITRGEDDADDGDGDAPVADDDEDAPMLMLSSLLLLLMPLSETAVYFFTWIISIPLLSSLVSSSLSLLFDPCSILLIFFAIFLMNE